MILYLFKNRPRGLRATETIKLPKCKFNDTLPPCRQWNFYFWIFMIFICRPIASWYVIQYRHVRHSRMSSPNGIQKSDISHHPFRSSSLVIISNTFSLAKHIFISTNWLNLTIASPLFIAGTKSDLRIPHSEKFITTAEGKKMRNKIKAQQFIECSAMKKDNLEIVFYEAVRAVEKRTSIKQRSCVLMWTQRSFIFSHRFIHPSIFSDIHSHTHTQMYYNVQTSGIIATRKFI